VSAFTLFSSTNVLIWLWPVIVAIAVVWSGTRVARELRIWREQEARERVLAVIALFAPGVAAAAVDPQALLGWQPLAVTARKLFPEAFGTLDHASGSTFPFNAEQIQAAHSRWTAEWLAWERNHDAEFKLKAAVAEAEIAEAGGGALARARLEAVEREKLELYQRHYERYIRIAKALQALLSSPSRGADVS
jgi:hypothetical protein